MSPVDLIEPLTYGFMQRALIVGAVAGVVCGVLSCFVTQLGWSLLGDGISHAVLPGVVLAYLLGVPFALGALAFALIAVALIGRVRGEREIRDDSAIGIVFTALFSLGIVLVSRAPSQIDLAHVLFGNVLGVRVVDLWQVIVLGGITLAVLVLKRRDFTLVAFDPAHARAIGLRPGLWRGVLLCALAVTVVTSMQAVGAVLVVSLLVTPGVTARLVTDRFGTMLWLAPLVGGGSAVGGVLLAYALDASAGGLITLTLSAVFAIVFCARTLGRRARRAGTMTACPPVRSRRRPKTP